MKVKDSDIKAVAEALVQVSVVSSFSGREVHLCRACDTRMYSEYKIQHKPDCPVLIAEKLLEEMK